MKIIIGNKYEIINSVMGHNGLIVTVTGYCGLLKDFNELRGDRWYVDIHLETSKGYTANHFGETQLKPIYDGNEMISWEAMKDIWTPEGVEA
jgi:hypothetical protein